MKKKTFGVISATVVLVLVIMAFVFLPARSETAGSKVVVTTGVGACGAGDDKAKARDEAVTDACRKAVEEGVGLFVKSDTLVKNSQLIEDNIYTKSKGYIKSYRVVKEGVKDDLYRVTVEATVLLSIIEKDLDGVWEQLSIASSPRFMVLIYDKKKKESQPVVENVLIDRLDTLGAKVVDPEQMEKVRSTDVAKKASEGDLAAAKSLALKYGAEILITGRAWCNPIQDSTLTDSGMYASEGRVEARGIVADRGLILASKKGQTDQAQLGPSAESADEKAAEAAAKDWMSKNMSKIIAAICDPVKNYKIILTGARSYSAVSRIDDSLRKLRFTRNTGMRDFSTAATEIEIDYVGPIRQLARDLESLRLAVTSVTANSVGVRVK
ncbi:MAG: hypothetical protein V2A78_10225 [bacterium]